MISVETLQVSTIKTVTKACHTTWVIILMGIKVVKTLINGQTEIILIGTDKKRKCVCQ